MYKLAEDVLRRGDFVKLMMFIPKQNPADPDLFGFLLTRGEQTFYYAFSLGTGIVANFWQDLGDGGDVMGIRYVMAMYGFKEIPIFRRYEGDDSFKKIEGGETLLFYINTYFAQVKELRKEAEKKAKEDAKLAKKNKDNVNQNVPVGVPSVPDLKVVKSDEAISEK